MKSMFSKHNIKLTLSVNNYVERRWFYDKKQRDPLTLGKPSSSLSLMSSMNFIALLPMYSGLKADITEFSSKALRGWKHTDANY